MQWALGVLGWSPKDFWNSTPLELNAAIKGWKTSNGVDDSPRNDQGKPILSANEVDYLKELMQDHG